MKTIERREAADRALSQLDQLEMEIRSKMTTRNLDPNAELPLDNEYVRFKSYAQLRDLNEQYTRWKGVYESHADHAELVQLVGQSEHDILREHYTDMTSQTDIIPIETPNTVYFYERDTGSGQPSKTSYKITFEKVGILPFYSCYLPAMNHLFIRVTPSGQPG